MAAGSSLRLLTLLGRRAWTSWRALETLETRPFRSIELMGGARQSAQNRRRAAAKFLESTWPRARNLPAGVHNDWMLPLEEVKALAPAELESEAGREFAVSEAAMFALERAAIERAASSQTGKPARCSLPSYTYSTAMRSP